MCRLAGQTAQPLIAEAWRREFGAELSDRALSDTAIALRDGRPVVRSALDRRLVTRPPPRTASTLTSPKSSSGCGSSSPRSHIGDPPRGARPPPRRQPVSPNPRCRTPRTPRPPNASRHGERR
ncbi:hypothetical protein HBB16_05245 [Pseudonocardia sp. MCCB 268]|nr:hypothetical protein [Pseudonocardia cytotoxica]